MIVRVLNQQHDKDKFFDCRNSCLQRGVNTSGTPPGETILTLEFTLGPSSILVLEFGDEVYYMNDAGKTVHSDCRMLKKDA